MPPDDMGIIDIILLNTADFLCISLFDAFQLKTGLASVAAAEAADTHNPVLDWNITQKIKCDKLSGHAAEAKADIPGLICIRPVCDY